MIFNKYHHFSWFSQKITRQNQEKSWFSHVFLMIFHDFSCFFKKSRFFMICHNFHKGKSSKTMIFKCFYNEFSIIFTIFHVVKCKLLFVLLSSDSLENLDNLNSKPWKMNWRGSLTQPNTIRWMSSMVPTRQVPLKSVHTHPTPKVT